MQQPLAYWPKLFKFTDISHVFRLVEWMTIGIFGVILAFDQPWPAWEARLILPKVSGYFILASLFGLSCWFPANRPLWQRRVYVAITVGLVVSASFAGYSFDILLYLLIAKSCFLLRRRDLLILLAVTGIAWNGSQIWLVNQSLDLINKVPSEIDHRRLMISTVLTSLGVYITACTFVMLLSLTIVREQRSRARAEQLTQEIETLAATVERSRIAREIHDSLGHTLTALNVQIELAQKLQQRDPDRARQSIDIAHQLSHQCLQDVRHAVHSMHDRTIDLNTAVQTLIQPMCNDPNVQMTAILKFPALSPTTSHQIYCIIREGLTNIQRHAQATQVQLQGQLVEDKIVVILRDNGVGFHLNQASTGFGLRGMTDRAQSFGGQLTIESAPQQGTRIQLECYLVQ